MSRSKTSRSISAHICWLLILMAISGVGDARQAVKPWAWTSASARFDAWDKDSGKGEVLIDRDHVVATFLGSDGAVAYRFNGHRTGDDVSGVLEVSDTDLDRISVKGTYKKIVWKGPSGGREVLLLEGGTILIGITREIDNPK